MCINSVCMYQLVGYSECSFLELRLREQGGRNINVTHSLYALFTVLYFVYCPSPSNHIVIHINLLCLHAWTTKINALAWSMQL